MSDKQEKLERTLGFWAALSIGTGTMIGAGLFVFPGIAAGRAGPAAMISFAIGGVIALLVAACTAELAVAMPRSGGAYVFVSRLFSPFVGFLVGACQTVGLVFASAFYLVAFARYSEEFLSELGRSLGDPLVVIASGTTLLLVSVNLVGARSAGGLQNSVVAALAVLIAVLFGYGFLDVVGLVGGVRDSGPFAPHGALPVLTTAALVFTSYLGFVQIATVAGEVERPSRTLPAALFSSVALVTMLYVLALFVSTRVISASELGRLGENGTTAVARRLFGGLGGITVLVAGALAALSSANASILSASRTLFAMGKDGLAPEVTSRVHRRFHTPYVSILVVAAPLLILVLVENLELLAETASAMHLVIYALLCVSLVVYRRQNRGASDQEFRIPFGNAVSVVGALSCAGLLAFMSGTTLLITLTIITLAFVGYVAFVRARAGND